VILKLAPGRPAIWNGSAGRIVTSDGLPFGSMAMESEGTLTNEKRDTANRDKNCDFGNSGNMKGLWFIAVIFSLKKRWFCSHPGNVVHHPNR
jgi:hypothetical protein